jgi:AcrR family transcriptional regulator
VRKSDRTRAAILESARRLFSTQGYELTTVREVAAGADIDPALVIRYFGGKDELFVRASDFELQLPQLDAVAPERVGEALVLHFLKVWEGPTSGASMAMLLRSAASNEHSAQKVRALFANQVQAAISKVGKRTTAPRRAALVASQLLGVALCRYVLKLPVFVEMSAQELVAHVAPTLQRYVND